MYEKYLYGNFLDSVMCEQGSVGEDFTLLFSVCHYYLRLVCACIWL
jgi:hypothetical protein